MSEEERLHMLAKANNTLARISSAERDRFRDALLQVDQWLLSVAECDSSEIVADGGITAGMVICQEAREQSRRLHRALTGDPA